MSSSPYLPKRALICGVVATGLAIFSPGPVLAATSAVDDMTLQAIINQTGSWSSNPVLALDGVKALWGSTTSPQLIFKSSTPLSQISIGAKIDQNIFNQASYDTTDMHATADLSKRNERWTAGVGGLVDYDSTRTSELSTVGSQPSVTRHLGYSLSPRVSFSFSPVEAISLSGSVSRSRYDSVAYSNYETFTVSSAYSRKFDLYNTGNFSVQARRYQTTRNNASRTDSLSPTIGWNTIFSERLTGHASVGAQKSREYSFGVATDQKAWQYVFSGGLSFKGFQDNLNLSASRTQTPAADGTESLQTSFSVNERHALNSLVSVNFNADYKTSKYQTTSTGSLKSLIGGGAGISYRVWQELDLTINYKYRYKTLINDARTAQDNAITVGLVFHPSEWALSE